MSLLKKHVPEAEMKEMAPVRKRKAEEELESIRFGQLMPDSMQKCSSTFFYSNFDSQQSTLCAIVTNGVASMDRSYTSSSVFSNAKDTKATFEFSFQLPPQVQTSKDNLIMDHSDTLTAGSIAQTSNIFAPIHVTPLHCHNNSPVLAVRRLLKPTNTNSPRKSLRTPRHATPAGKTSLCHVSVQEANAVQHATPTVTNSSNTCSSITDANVEDIFPKRRRLGLSTEEQVEQFKSTIQRIQQDILGQFSKQSSNMSRLEPLHAVISLVDEMKELYKSNELLLKDYPEYFADSGPLNKADSSKDQVVAVKQESTDEPVPTQPSMTIVASPPRPLGIMSPPNLLRNSTNLTAQKQPHDQQSCTKPLSSLAGADQSANTPKPPLAPSVTSDLSNVASKHNTVIGTSRLSTDVCQLIKSKSVMRWCRAKMVELDAEKTFEYQLIKTVPNMSIYIVPKLILGQLHDQIRTSWPEFGDENVNNTPLLECSNAIAGANPPQKQDYVLVVMYDKDRSYIPLKMDLIPGLTLSVVQTGNDDQTRRFTITSTSSSTRWEGMTFSLSMRQTLVDGWRSILGNEWVDIRE